jgi:exopolysaccharide biosynthesis WecB/TagA/CpsF family protein
MIGGSHKQAQQIAIKYGLTNLRHHNPPMGFIKDPAAVEECSKFIESASPFRFCFLAVGSPQQEAIAYALRTHGIARGLALCIGASLNFLTGVEKRAPTWMQCMALEWLYRLLRNPRRLAVRYLVRGPFNSTRVILLS